MCCSSRGDGEVDMSSESASLRVGIAIGPSVAGAASIGLSWRLRYRRSRAGETLTGTGKERGGTSRLPVERNGEGAAEIGAPQLRTGPGESIKRGGGGMTVPIVSTGTDRREARAQHIEQWAAGSGGAAVVGDLEQIPTTAITRDDLQQVVVAVLFEVTRKQRSLATDAHREHDRGVVDGPAR
jgi:hypothetical protein